MCQRSARLQKWLTIIFHNFDVATGTNQGARCCGKGAGERQAWHGGDVYSKMDNYPQVSVKATALQYPQPLLGLTVGSEKVSASEMLVYLATRTNDGRRLPTRPSKSCSCRNLKM